MSMRLERWCDTAWISEAWSLEVSFCHLLLLRRCTKRDGAVAAYGLVGGATFGFEQNGDAIFTAIVRNWTEGLPERGISEFGSLVEEVAAARSFLEEVLGPIDSEDIVAMLDSIDEAIVSGRSLNLAERNFLDHELLEAQLVASGTPQPAAHLETLLTVPRGSDFSPSVLVNPDVPSPSVDLAFWGLS